MDKIDCQTLQKQVQTLCDKVDTLQTIVAELRPSSETPHRGYPHAPHRHNSVGNAPAPPDSATNEAIWEIHEPSFTDGEQDFAVPHYLAHKDIIKDDETAFPFWSYTESASLTPDLQIRRLTAQLTAAYHRIAALEEQIMAQRHHPLPSLDS